MSPFSLRKYDQQAWAGVFLSVLSILPVMAMIIFVVKRLDFGSWTFYYGPRAAMVYMGTGLIAMALAAAGFGFGMNSAGQRRNDVPALSWVAFFIGALVFSITVLLLFFFRMRGETVIG